MIGTQIERRHPPWLKVRAPGGAAFAETTATVRELELHTVCQEARVQTWLCWAKTPLSCCSGYLHPELRLLCRDPRSPARCRPG